VSNITPKLEPHHALGGEATGKITFVGSFIRLLRACPMTLTRFTKFLAASALAIPAAFVATSSAQSQSQSVVFTLLNRTSSPLIRFYASPSGTRSWEEDIMEGSVLRPGQSVRVTIADGRRACLYDIRGDFADGDKVEDYKVNICKIDTYRFVER
jgi:hypothetical protein